MTQAQISQIVVKTLADGTPEARISQVVMKALADGTPQAQISQIVIKVLADYVDAAVGDSYPYPAAVL